MRLSLDYEQMNSGRSISGANSGSKHPLRFSRDRNEFSLIIARDFAFDGVRVERAIQTHGEVLPLAD